MKRLIASLSLALCASGISAAETIVGSSAAATPGAVVLRDGSGNFNANNITAVHFIGDGSLLTNVGALAGDIKGIQNTNVIDPTNPGIGNRLVSAVNAGNTAIGVTHGGTGTLDGSITGTGSLAFTATGTNSGVSLVAGATGFISLNPGSGAVGIAGSGALTTSGPISAGTYTGVGSGITLVPISGDVTGTTSASAINTGSATTGNNLIAAVNNSNNASFVGVTHGGTGTTNGSITGTGSLTFQTTGTNNTVSLVAGATGSISLNPGTGAVGIAGSGNLTTAGTVTAGTFSGSGSGISAVPIAGDVTGTSSASTINTGSAATGNRLISALNTSNNSSFVGVTHGGTGSIDGSITGPGSLAFQSTGAASTITVNAGSTGLLSIQTGGTPQLQISSGAVALQNGAVFTGMPKSRYHQSAPQPIAGAGVTILNFDATDYNVFSGPTIVAGSKLTVTKPGFYRITGSITSSTFAVEYNLSMILNGFQNIAKQANAATPSLSLGCSVSTDYFLTPTDYVQLELINAGAGFNTIGTETTFQIHMLP